MSFSRGMRAKLMILSSLGSLALVVAFARCSPIAPSFDKNSLHGGTLGGGSFPIPGTQPNNVHIFVYKTRVLDGESYESSTAPLPASQKAVINGSDALGEFKAERQIPFTLPATFSPDEGAGYFEVALSASDVSSYDLSQFDTSFKPISDGTWMLTISPNTPEDVARKVLDSLVEITIYVDTAMPGSASSGLTGGATGPTGTSGSSGPTGVSGNTGTTGPS